MDPVKLILALMLVNVEHLNETQDVEAFDAAQHHLWQSASRAHCYQQVLAAVLRTEPVLAQLREADEKLARTLAEVPQARG